MRLHRLLLVFVFAVTAFAQTPTRALIPSEPDAASQGVLDFMAAERARPINEQQAFWRLFELSLSQSMCKEKAGKYVADDQMQVQACRPVGAATPSVRPAREKSPAVPEYVFKQSVTEGQISIVAEPRRASLRRFSFDGSQISYTAGSQKVATGLGAPLPMFSALVRYADRMRNYPDFPRIITFEKYPTGVAVCEACLVTDEFEDWGVVFSGKAFLENSARYDRADALPNHNVQKMTGGMQLAFPTRPVAVQFERVINPICDIPIDASDSNDRPATVAVVQSRRYTSRNQVEFQRDIVVVYSPAGVARLSVTHDTCGFDVDNMVVRNWSELAPWR